MRNKFFSKRYALGQKQGQRERVGFSGVERGIVTIPGLGGPLC